MRVVTRWVVGLGLSLCAGKLHPNAVLAQGGVHEFREAHLGMEMRLVVVHDDAEQAARLARRAFDGVEAHEAVLSDWRARSEVRALEMLEPGHWKAVSPALRDVLAIALDVARATDGAFDPTIGALTELWREARDSGLPIDDTRRAAALARVGYRHVELDTAASRIRFGVARMRLDLGAVAKGWILDEALRELMAGGASAALAEAGGDIVVRGAPPGGAGWRIRVPIVGGDTVLTLTAGAVSSSGSSAQRLVDRAGREEPESHVMDPRDGRGKADTETITVLGPSGALTDALATAVSVTPRAGRRALAAKFGVTLVAPPER